MGTSRMVEDDPIHGEWTDHALEGSCVRNPSCLQKAASRAEQEVLRAWPATLQSIAHGNDGGVPAQRWTTDGLESPG